MSVQRLTVRPSARNAERLNQPAENPVPNQLASTKRRQSLAEPASVLAALAEIARREGTTAMALMRQGGA